MHKCVKCQVENCANCNISNLAECLYCSAGYRLDSNGKCTQCKASNCMTCDYDLNYCDECANGYTHDMMNGSSTYGQCIGIRGANCGSADPYNLDICTSCRDPDYWNLNDDGICERRWEEIQSKKKGLSTGAIVGIVVACVVVVGLVVFLLVFFLVCKKKSVGISSSE